MTASVITEIRVDDVKVPRDRARKDLGDVAGLARSIRNEGLLHPIVVEPDGTLVVGRRRLAAVRSLGWETVPALVREDGDRRLAEAAENTFREQLRPTEALALARRLWPDVQRRVGGQGARNDLKAKLGGVGELLGEIDRTVTTTQAEVARMVGYSATNLRKIRFVVAERDAGRLDGSVVAEMDCSGRVHGAWQEASRAARVRKARGRPPLHVGTGVFDVICADPPWFLEGQGQNAPTNKHVPYAQMSLDEIRDYAVDGRSVRALAAPNATLWLWVTDAHLPDAFGVIDAWGFTYKRAFVWNKVKPVMVGTLHIQSQKELFLLGVRGSPTFDASRPPRDLLEETKREHSRKPEAFYRLVEDLCPGRRMELFGRRERDGWVVHGDEVAGP